MASFNLKDAIFYVKLLTYLIKVNFLVEINFPDLS